MQCYHIKIISQFCRIGKDCDRNGDGMSKNNEKLPYLHKVTKKYLKLAMIIWESVCI